MPINWNQYVGVKNTALIVTLEGLRDTVSAMESDKINYEMNLEHLTADLAAMTASRDELLRLYDVRGQEKARLHEQLQTMTAERDALRRDNERMRQLAGKHNVLDIVDENLRLSRLQWHTEVDRDVAMNERGWRAWTGKPTGRELAANKWAKEATP